MKFKEFFYKLTEMPHSNKTDYDYDIEYFNPIKGDKFEELKDYILKLTSGDNNTISSPINKYDFISTPENAKLAKEDFLNDELRIIPKFLMDWYGDKISPIIIIGNIPITNRSKHEINAYKTWIHRLANKNI